MALTLSPPEGRPSAVLAIATVSAVLVYALASLLPTSPSAPSPAVTLSDLQSLISSRERVLVLFRSPSCPVCAAIWPAFVEASSELSESGVLCVDVLYRPGLNDDLFSAMRIVETPTFILFVDGREAARHMGVLLSGPLRRRPVRSLLHARGVWGRVVGGR